MEPEFSFKCSSCQTVYYCGKTCQIRHWKDHKVLCGAIKSLAVIVEDTKTVKTAFVSHITSQKHSKIIKLVGEKCLVECLLNENKEHV